MLKRKRVSKRSTNNSRKGRNSISGSAASAGNADSADSQAASSASAAAAAGFDMPQLVHANAHGHPESSSTTTISSIPITFSSIIFIITKSISI